MVTDLGTELGFQCGMAIHLVRSEDYQHEEERKLLTYPTMWNFLERKSCLNGIFFLPLPHVGNDFVKVTERLLTVKVWTGGHLNICHRNNNRFTEWTTGHHPQDHVNKSVKAGKWGLSSSSSILVAIFYFGSNLTLLGAIEWAKNFPSRIPEMEYKVRKVFLLRIYSEVWHRVMEQSERLNIAWR